MKIKHYPIILFLAFFSIALFYSCQKEVSKEVSSNGNFIAKIDNTQWTADTASVILMNNMISISGIDIANKYMINISLIDSGVHKYQLSDNALNTAALIDNLDINKNAYTSNQGIYPSESGGEVNITSIDTTNKTINGTFSFKVFRTDDNNQKIITEGNFTNLIYK